MRGDLQNAPLTITNMIEQKRFVAAVTHLNDTLAVAFSEDLVDVKVTPCFVSLLGDCVRYLCFLNGELTVRMLCAPNIRVAI